MTTFKMKNELTGVSIKIDNPDITEEMVVAAYRLTAGKPQTSLIPFFSRHPNTPEPEPVTAPSEPIQQLRSKLKEIAVEAKKEKQEATVVPVAPSRPRQVKLVGSENTGSNPIGEMARFKDTKDYEQPREHVKAYINCPACSYEGDRFTILRSTFSKCPECDAKLFNRYASENAHEANEDGYTYLATSEMKFREREEGNGLLSHREQMQRGLR